MDYFSKLSLLGLRGFDEVQTIDLAIPNGESGSGLTVIVGPNNAGKSTVIEALKVFGRHQTPSIPKGKRNDRANQSIAVTLEKTNAEKLTIRTKNNGGSETEWVPALNWQQHRDWIVFTLPSRRTFNPFFGKNLIQRDAYLQNQSNNVERNAVLSGFDGRIFRIEENREKFNQVLYKIVDIDDIPDWNIDLADNGQHYINVRTGSGSHNSEGLGEGIVSLFFW
jgi:predicted ATP-dependent endonuclease of OLD family